MFVASLTLLKTHNATLGGLQMAKKIVRGITDVKTINNQDFDTNNVNDLLSDGQYNYIHRKKGETEEYHNLTDNIKTISSDNTELLSVTNNNKTTNTATLHPKHDAQKEQVLESTRDTVTIGHGSNATDETTKVDTNPKKVLEHENLISDSEYITLNHQTGENTTHIQTAALEEVLMQLYQAISSSGGATSTIDHDHSVAGKYQYFKHVVTHGYSTLVTFTFDCEPTFTECELLGNIKQDLEKFVKTNMTVSNGTVSLTNDGTNMKLINSGPSENVHQQGTFTFYDITGGGTGGGGGVSN